MHEERTFMKKSLKNVTIKLLLSFMIVAVMAFFMPINVSAAAPGKGSKETIEVPEEEPSEEPEVPEEPSEEPEVPEESPEEPEIQVRSSSTTFTWEVEAETPAETPSATTTWNWEVEAELPATGENDMLLVVAISSLIMFFATYLKKNNRSEESASIQNEETREAYGYSQNSLFEADGALVKGFQHLVFMALYSIRMPLVKEDTGLFQSVGGRLKNCS